MASIYYDCLSLPEELELKIMGMKRGMEIYDIQLENKKKLLDHINDFNNIVYEDQGFYYDDIDETHRYYRWIRTVKDMDWYQELLRLRKEEEDEEEYCGCLGEEGSGVCDDCRIEEEPWCYENSTKDTIENDTCFCSVGGCHLPNRW